MAKIEVRYPNGVVKEYYVTTEFLPTPEQTRGRVKQLGNVRFYIKPSLGKILVRKANVMRRSKAVVQINEQLENLRDSESHPAHVCGGRSWNDFVTCLSTEMKKVIKPVYTGVAQPSSRSTRIA